MNARRPFPDGRRVVPLVCLAALVWAAPVGALDRDADADHAVAAMQGAAAGPVGVVRSPETGLAVFVRTAPGGGIPVAGATAAERALSFTAAYGRAFGLPEGADLVVRREIEDDEAGMGHVRLQQQHGGIPVAGAEMIVHLRDGWVVAANGKALKDVAGIPNVATLTAAKALEAARTTFGKRASGARGISFSVPRLEILDASLLGGAGQRRGLAYFVEARGENVREFIWVDARRGAILLRFSQLAHALNRTIHTKGNVPGDSLPGTLVRSEGDPASGDVDADRAYDFSGDTYAYFMGEHGRDSYDGAGAPLVSTVDFCPATGSCPYANAFWNGQQMVYGDGFSAADDVDAHELTHAVTESSARLYYYMQSGALNESYSDIFGETVDLLYAHPGLDTDTPAVRWQMGEDVPVFGALRNMMNPTLFGDPGKMSDPQFKCPDSELAGFDQGGVHSNSGVPNHAYALMVDGGTYNGKTMTGMGLLKAGKIQYRALTQYLTSGSNFLDNYQALLQACADLVGGPAGITAGDCVQVKNAAEAVQMQKPWKCLPANAAEPSLCPVGRHADVAFHDDFENETSGNWTNAAVTAVNHWNGGLGAPDVYFDVFARSESQHLWGVDADVVGDSNVATQPTPLRPGSRLQFRHSYGFEADPFVAGVFYDGGVAEYSINAGSTWTDAGPLIAAGARYGGTLQPLAAYGQPLGGRKAFVGESWGYTATQLNLSSLAGNATQFRFRIGTDQEFGDLGWFIDDVTLYSCEVGGTVQFALGAYSVDESAGVLNLQVTRSGSLTGITVDYDTADGTAVDGVDYTGAHGSLTFDYGVTSATLPIPILADDLDEDSETFTLALSNLGSLNPVGLGGAVLGSAAQVPVTILDNDTTGTVQFAAPSYLVAEGGSATVTVARTAGTAPFTVGYTTSNGTAVAPGDYLAAGGTLSFGAGEMAKTFQVDTVADSAGEGNEIVNLFLAEPTNRATLGPRAGVPLTLQENTTLLQFSAPSYPAPENAPKVTVTVRRTGVATSALEVSYATGTGTATPGADYTARSGTLSFAPGILTRTFDVPLLDDASANEGAVETVPLILSGVTGSAVLGPQSSAVIQIQDNDARFKLGAPAYSVVEGIPMAKITISRMPATGAGSVDLQLFDETANLGSDYTGPVTLPVAFAAGVASRTVTIPIVNDADPEEAETVLLMLANPVGGGLGTPEEAVLTINDNEPKIQLGAASYSVAEGKAVTVILRRLGTPSVPCTVQLVTSGGSATPGVDYNDATTIVSFGPGVVSRTVSVSALADVLAEGQETIDLSLNGNSGCGLGSPASGVIRISGPEPVFSIGLAAYTVSEVAASATVTVRRTGPLGSAATVDFATGDGSAQAGSDYIARSGTLSFPAGASSQTFQVPIVKDAEAEGPEAFGVSLSNPSAGHGLGAYATAEVRITDNDPAGSIQIGAATFTVDEGSGVALLTLRRSGGTAGGARVACGVARAGNGPGFADETDFVVPPDLLTVIFGPGETVKTLPIALATADGAEGVEAFLFKLAFPGGGATLGPLQTATVFVVD